MPEELFKAVIPGIVGLLVIWLAYRIEKRIKKIVKNEIYNDFPTVKADIDNFEHRIDYLKLQVETLERRVLLLEERVKGG